MYIRVKLRGFVSSCRWMVASPPWRRGPQVRAPWHHGGHGAVDVVGPMAPPGHESGRGGKGVYTDRRKRPLGAVLGHLCTLLRRCGQTWGRRSVHRLAKMAPRRRFGPFVYTVATRAAMRVATRAAGRCRARHRSAGLRRSAFQMNGKRLMGGSSRSCTPRRVCPIRFKALTRQSSLHTGFSALCLPAWQVA